MAFGDGTLCLDGQPPQVFSRHNKQLKPTAFTGWQVEMDDLLEAILAGRPYNEGEYGATSTMTSILGRMASYSGQVVEWDQGLQSSLDLVPRRWSWDTIPAPKPGPDGVYPCALHGVTRAY